MRLNCFIVAIHLWYRTHLRDTLTIRRSHGLGGYVPHFTKIRDLHTRHVVTEYIPLKSKDSVFDEGDNFILFNGKYRIRIYKLIGEGSSSNLLEAVKLARKNAKESALSTQ